MQIREGMSDVVLTVGPGHSLRDAAGAMHRRNVGAAVVVILVGWAFYSTLGGHAEPKPGAAARDVTSPNPRSSIRMNKSEKSRWIRTRLSNECGEDFLKILPLPIRHFARALPPPQPTNE